MDCMTHFCDGSCNRRFLNKKLVGTIRRQWFSNKKWVGRHNGAAVNLAPRWMYWDLAECIENSLNVLRTFPSIWGLMNILCTSMVGQNFARGVENKGSGENLDTPLLCRSFYGRLLLNRFTLCCDQDFITHNFVPWPKKCQILLTLMVSFSSSSFLCRGK